MTTQPFEAAFERVKELVATFASGESSYLSPDYQEAEARKDFIDKFFIALGWDVNHETQTNPYAQEVKVERTPSGTQRRADYAFFLAPNFRDVRFYVEAKKPHGHIATPDNYFQAIRYGSSSRTPLVALTDFQEFHVLDSRFKADIKIILKRGLRRYGYRDYADREKFSEIYWLFSHEAVMDGSIEKFTAGLPKKGKDIPPPRLQNVDDAFLDELEEYRAELARAFKKHDGSLDSDTLTEITQRTLDRLVFMRFLEDKLIEPKPMVARFPTKDSPWHAFIAESRRLDHIYNGIVFKKHAIIDDPGFRFEDRAFTETCRRLSDPHSPYDFDAIPIHILGSIYERFLGKVIVATDKRVRVEDKPEVRKAGGVYYTPEYIVRYIVENTVGKLIAGKSPAQIAEMRFADIACGSGSFLLAVYDLLLEYHGNYYNVQPKAAREADWVERDGRRYLSLAKKREILLNNIHGVDIDAQAVEVAQLSLYLRLLKEETTASARTYQLEIKETLLPSLANNIVCGNSLIETDILDCQLFPSEDERKVNPMNFRDAFPQVMKRGGFDAIVGNPPYGAEFSDAAASYLSKRYDTFVWRGESYLAFVERAMKALRVGGIFGYIIPDTYLNLKFTAALRSFLLQHTKLTEVLVLPSRVFGGATVDTTILLTERAPRIDTVHRAKVTVKVFKKRATLESLDKPERRFSVSTELWHSRGSFNVQSEPTETAILDKVHQSCGALADSADLFYGIKAYQVGKGDPPQTRKIRDAKPFTAERQMTKAFLPFYDGKDIGRYETYWRGNNWIKYGRWLAEPRTPEKYEGQKILIRKIVGETLIATYIPETSYCNTLLFTLKLKPNPKLSYRFLLGVLNSKFIGWYFRKKFQISAEDTFPQIMIQDILQFPIPAPDQSRNAKMVRLVDRMLETKRQLAKVTAEKDKRYYENKCAGLDNEIDRLVYDLYCLTEDEIRIVEDPAKSSSRRRNAPIGERNC